MAFLPIFIRCHVIEHATLGGALKLEETVCFRYLAELHRYILQRSPTVDNNRSIDATSASAARRRGQKRSYVQPPVLLRIRLELWEEFNSQWPQPAVFTESEMYSLWFLFASVALAEGFFIPIEPNCDTPLQPKTGQLDFRHFSLLLFLQTRRPVATVRTQLYNRFIRSSSEVVYPNPAAAAAAYRHAAQVTGGLVSPRNTPRLTTSHSRTHSKAASAVSSYESVGSISPRATKNSLANSQGLTNPADELKNFLTSKLPIMLRLVHFAVLGTEVNHVVRKHVDSLSILLEPPTGKCLSSVLFPITDKSTNSLTVDVAANALSECIIIDPITLPILSRTGSLGSSMTNASLSLLVATSSSSIHSSETRSTAASQTVASIDTSDLKLMPSITSWDKNAIIIEACKKEIIYRLDGPIPELRSNPHKISGQLQGTDINNNPFMFDDPYRSSSARAVLKTHKKPEAVSKVSANTKNSDIPPGRTNVENIYSSFSSSSIPPSSAVHPATAITLSSLESDASSAYLGDLIDCHVYILKRVRYVKIQSCKSCRIVIPVVHGCVYLTACSNVELFAVGRSFKIENCYETKLHIYSATRPILTGDTRGTIIGPYGAVFSKQLEFMDYANMRISDEMITLWSIPIVLGISPSRHQTLGLSTMSISPNTSPPQSLALSARHMSSSLNTKETNTEFQNQQQQSKQQKFQAPLETPEHNKNSSPSKEESMNLCSFNSAEDSWPTGIFMLESPSSFRLFIVPEIQEDTVNSSSEELNISLLPLPELYAESLKEHQIKTLESFNAMALLTAEKIQCDIPSSEDCNTNDNHCLITQLHQNFLTWIAQSGFSRELVDLSRIDLMLLAMAQQGNTNNNSIETKYHNNNTTNSLELSCRREPIDLFPHHHHHYNEKASSNRTTDDDIYNNWYRKAASDNLKRMF